MIALSLSTRPASSSPPACAWQVSRQKPTRSAFGEPAIAVHSRSIFYSPRAIDFVPPAVFSISSGTSMVSPSMALRQFW